MKYNSILLRFLPCSDPDTILDIMDRRTGVGMMDSSKGNLTEMNKTSIIVPPENRPSSRPETP